MFGRSCWTAGTRRGVSLAGHSLCEPSSACNVRISRCLRPSDLPSILPSSEGDRTSGTWQWIFVIAALLLHGREAHSRFIAVRRHPRLLSSSRTSERHAALHIRTCHSNKCAHGRHLFLSAACQTCKAPRTRDHPYLILLSNVDSSVLPSLYAPPPARFLHVNRGTRMVCRMVRRRFETCILTSGFQSVSRHAECHPSGGIQVICSHLPCSRETWEKVSSRARYMPLTARTAWIDRSTRNSSWVSGSNVGGWS